MPKQVRVRGHTLIAEGKPFTKWGDRIFPEVGPEDQTNVKGRAKCSCGIMSDPLKSEPVSVGTLPISRGSSPMGRPEHYVEGYLVDECRRRGWWTAKFTSPGMRGVPDQIIVTPATTCFVETKSDNGSLRRQQIRVITHMRRSGARVYTAYSRQEVDNIINELQLLNNQTT